MQQFRLSEKGYKQLRKKSLRVTIPLFIVILAAASLITNGTSGNEDVGTSFFVIPFVAIILGFSLYRGLGKQKELWMSYSVTISNDGITREQVNTRPLSISFMEIKEIIKSEKGNFTIKGAGRTDVILIPYWIDDHATLEQRLQTLAPITANTKDPWHLKYRLFLSLLLVAMMVAVYTSTNKILVGICGVLLTGFLAWSFYEIHTNKNLPDKTKRISWFFLIVVASIIYVTYTKLTGNPFPH
jgi:hypothetical protein